MSGFQAKGMTLRAGSFRLPRLEMQHLAVAVKSQNVALRNYTGVALLASLRASRRRRLRQCSWTSRMVPCKRAQRLSKDEPSVNFVSTLFPFCSRTPNFIVMFTHVGGS